MAGNESATRDSEDDTARAAAVAIIERGNVAPSPLQSATRESDKKQNESLRQLAIELGRAVDA